MCRRGPRDTRGASAKTSSRGGPSNVFLVAHARSLAGQVAEIEEASPPDDTLADDLYLLDARRVREENALDAHVEAHFADRERASSARSMTLDDDPLKYLGSLLVAFDDAVVDSHAVANAKLGKVGPKEGRFQLGQLG